MADAKLIFRRVIDFLKFGVPSTAGFTTGFIYGLRF